MSVSPRIWLNYPEGNSYEFEEPFGDELKYIVEAILAIREGLSDEPSGGIGE